VILVARPQVLVAEYAQRLAQHLAHGIELRAQLAGQDRTDRPRIQLARDAIVRPLDVVGGRIARDAEDLEVVALLDQCITRQQRRAPVVNLGGGTLPSIVGRMSSNS
jgi:hypothetical protein